MSCRAAIKPATHGGWSDVYLSRHEPVDVQAELSTERAESSRGFPVLVVDGVALGSAEVPSDWRVWVDTGPTDTVRAARAAGYRVLCDEY